MPSITDPYDSLDLGAMPFKPEDEEVGISITITCTDATPKSVQTKEGKEGVAIIGVEDDGTLRDWVAWNLHNKRAVALTKPLPGDRIKITFLGRDAHATNAALAAKLFKIDVLSRAGDKVAVGQGELPESY